MARMKDLAEEIRRTKEAINADIAEEIAYYKEELEEEENEAPIAEIEGVLLGLKTAREIIDRHIKTQDNKDKERSL